MYVSLDIDHAQAFYDNAMPIQWEGRGEVPILVGAAIVIAQTKLPQTYDGVILSYGVTVRDPTYEYTGTLSFQILINGNPMLDNGTGPWTLQRGSVTAPIPTLIKVPMNAQLTFVATRLLVSALPQTVDFSAQGWMKPRDMKKQNISADKFRV